MDHHLVATLVASMLAGFAMAGNIAGTDVSTTPADTSKVYDIDEVVVVAQPKESFALRRQPVSSSMFSADDIEAYGVRDLRELSNYVPAFVMPQYGSRLTSSMYVRGIGSRVNSPAVGVYVDGIPIMSKSAFNTHSYAMERVDILRGPQGTLYGQNSEGGLVRMYTLNPMHYQGTDVKLGVGSHFYRNAEVAHYAKVAPTLALSTAAFYNGQNGFFRNANTGDRADLSNEAGGRFRLVWQPSDRFTADWANDYQYVRQNGFPYGLYTPGEGTKAPSTTDQSNYRRNAFVTGLTLNARLNGFNLASTTSYQYMKDYMYMDQDYLPEDYMHLMQRQHQNSLTEELVLKSVGDSRWHHTTGVFGSYQWLKTQAPVYFGEGITRPIASAIQNAMYGAMLNSMAARMAQQGMPMDRAMEAATAAIDKAGGVSMEVKMEVPGLFHTPQFNLGLFHQTDFAITDRLTATLGLRYDYSRVEIDYDSRATMAMTAHVMGQDATYTALSHLLNHTDNSYNQLLPKLGLTYRTDLGNVYATVSKGYRAGGFNIQMFSDILQTEINEARNMAMRGDYEVTHDDDAYERVAKTIAYKPEESWNYEVGAHLDLFDHAVKVDASAYFMQVHNQQLSVMAGNYGFGRMMVNAGKSYSCGVELAARGKALDNHLAWGLSWGLTHAAFKEYKDTVSVTVHGAGGPVTESQAVDYKGKRVPFVPRHTLAGNVDYRVDMESAFLQAVTFGINAYLQGSTYWDEANTSKQKPYTVLGAHADADMGWLKVSLWGRNLTDTRYNTFVVSSAAAGFPAQFAQRGNPFQVGCDVRLHF